MTQTEEIFFKMHWSYFAGEYPIIQSKIGKTDLMSEKKRIEGMYRSKSQSDNIAFKMNLNLNQNNPNGNYLKVVKGNGNNNNNFNSSLIKKINPLQRVQFVNNNFHNLKSSYNLKGKSSSNISNNNSQNQSQNYKVNKKRMNHIFK